MNDSWVLHGQFVFSKQPLTFNRDGFRTVQLGDLAGFVHTSLSVTKVNYGQTWEFIFFGLVIRNGRCLADGEVLQERNEFEFHEIRKVLSDYSGRLIAIVISHTDGNCYLFTDAFASLPVVYDAASQTFGSTNTILQEDLRSKDLESILAAPADTLDEFDFSSQFLPAGMTPHAEVSRLLPNHVLNLGTFEAQRYWPDTPFPESKEANDIALAQRAASVVRNNIHAIPSDVPLVMGLTAGRDSRVLLAALLGKTAISDVRTFTFDYGNRSFGNNVDVHIGKRLAAQHNVNWRRVKAFAVSDRFRHLYKFNTGGCVSTNKARDFLQAASDVDLDSSWITGFGGEVAGGQFLQKLRHNDTMETLNPVRLLSRQCLPLRERYIDRVGKWKQSIPEFANAPLLVTLFYIENRLGCWASTHTYGTAPFKLHVIPFCDMRYVDACLRMSLPFRKSRASQLEMIRYLQPQLLALPFAKFSGFHRLAWRVRKSKYGRIFRKMPLCLEPLWQ